MRIVKGGIGTPEFAANKTTKTKEHMATYTAGTPTQFAGPVADGDYRLAVIGAEEKTSSSGNSMIALKHEIIGPVGGKDLPESGRPHVYDNLVFTPNAFWKIDQFRAAIGEDVVEGQEVDIEADALLGATLTAHVTLGKNEKTGKDRNEIGAYLIPEDGGPF